MARRQESGQANRQPNRHDPPFSQQQNCVMKSTQKHPKHLILARAWIGLLVLLSGSSAKSQIAGGTALSLNGNNGYASVTLSETLTNYTISAWVYLQSGGVIANPR